MVGLTVKTSLPHQFFHVYLDQLAVAAGEPAGTGPGIFRFTGNAATIPGLSVGHHVITVVLGDGKGTRIGQASGKVEFDVAGPAVKATAPAEVAQATGFTVEAAVEGVEIVEPARDTGAGGRTGHLHFIVDPPGPPPADGQPIPQDATHIDSAELGQEFQGLPAGAHTVWVVVGDRNHIPLNPLVADRVVVTVK